MAKLDGLKVGDTVYVVGQKRVPHYTGTHTVAKIGHKYSYIEHNGALEPFCIENGASHHNPNHNVRSNNFGFDVYRSEQDYLDEMEHEQQRIRLAKRFGCSAWNFVKLSHSATMQIHAILDAEGIDRKDQPETR